jgi:glutamine amidotransferase
MSAVQQVAIIDYGMGNLDSVSRRFRRVGVDAKVTANPADVLKADKLVLPGVGHFREAMSNLASLDLLDALHEAARVKRVPVLGICLGMQLMARRSEEGTADGLGWLDAEVIRFSVADSQRHKVPHIGWSRITVRKESALMSGVPGDAEFYFVHSYNLRSRSPEIVLCESEYEQPFTSAVEHDNLFGVQFHPEKSHDAGALVLRNFLAI